MVNRRTLACDSCGARFVTRTAIGHGDSQSHSFACPNCKLTISFVLVLDQEQGTFNYKDPVNGKWDDEPEAEDKAITVVTLDSERPVPTDLQTFSPFIETFNRIANPEAYRRDEGRRRWWCKDVWRIAERLIVHYANGNFQLFDQEAKRLGLIPSPTKQGRLAAMAVFLERAFDFFCPTNSRGAIERVRQRLALSKSISASLVQKLAADFRSSGRLGTLWREFQSIRNSAVSNYALLMPLIQYFYWRPEAQQPVNLLLSTKHFDAIKSLYIDCFETTWRSLVIVAGVESIIEGRQDLCVTTRKGGMTLSGFQSMANGAKPDVFRQYPIADLFLSSLDHKLRNGIGHHAAHFNAATDEVVYYALADDGSTSERKILYTEFVIKAAELYARCELAQLYFWDLLAQAGGDLN